MFTRGHRAVCYWSMTSSNSALLGANDYRKVASSNMSRLEAHAGFFRLLMKGIFDPYVL